MDIVLFHTAQSNIAVFEQAACGVNLDAKLHHVVRADLLQRAQQAGSLTQDIEAEAVAAMAEFAADGQQLLCTCSTIGPAADSLASEGLHVTRADRALAQASFRHGGAVGVIVAAPTTMEATRQIFAEAATNGGNLPFVLHMVDGAWAHFSRGALDAYYSALANAVVTLQDRYSVIALAQASMAPVAALTGWTTRILDSPSSSLRIAAERTA